MDIVIGEGIPSAINVTLVEDATVVRCRVLGVVTLRTEARLALTTSQEHRGAVESSTDTRDDGEVNLVVARTDLERTAVAAPDVLGRGLGVAAVVALALECVALDAALDVAGRSLRVDDEVLVAEAVPDLVDVLFVVAGESGRVDVFEGLRRQDAERSAVRMSDAVGGPFLAVTLSLGNEVVADLRYRVTGEANDFLDIAVGSAKVHADDETYEVDEADVAPDDALGCQGEFGESVVETGTGILEVVNGGLDKTVLAAAGDDHEEGEVTLSKVDATRVKSKRESDLVSFALGGKRDGEVVRDLNGGGRTSRTGVDQVAICTDEDDTLIRVEGVDVHVDLASIKVVDNLNIQSRRLFLLGSIDVCNLHPERAVLAVSTVQGVLIRDNDVLCIAGLDDCEAIGFWLWCR